MEAIRRIVCITRELCFSYQKLHGFFRVLSSSSKLHDFYADSSSNSMQLCKLSSKLHEKMPKKSDLILIRKIRGFLKIVDFGPFFSSQLEAPQVYVERSSNSMRLCKLSSEFHQKTFKNGGALELDRGRVLVQDRDNIRLMG